MTNQQAFIIVPLSTKLAAVQVDLNWDLSLYCFSLDLHALTHFLVGMLIHRDKQMIC